MGKITPDASNFVGSRTRSPPGVINSRFLKEALGKRFFLFSLWSVLLLTEKVARIYGFFFPFYVGF